MHRFKTTEGTPSGPGEHEDFILRAPYSNISSVMSNVLTSTKSVGTGSKKAEFTFWISGLLNTVAKCLANKSHFSELEEITRAPTQREFRFPCICSSQMTKACEDRSEAYSAFCEHTHCIYGDYNFYIANRQF